MTALARAAEKGFFDVTQALIAAGADVNVTDRVSWILPVAMSDTPPIIVQKLWTPLHYAAATGAEEIVRLLLAEPSVCVNAEDVVRQSAEATQICGC